MDKALLVKDLVRDEGVVLHPYRDSVGKLTIGIGRNLDDVGISNAEAEMLLANDIAKVEAQLDKALPWWRAMSEPRQRALANMCFNMGLATLLTFKNTLAMLKAGKYAEAADNALKSKWARQVGKRAIRVTDMLRDG